MSTVPVKLMETQFSMAQDIVDLMNEDHNDDNQMIALDLLDYLGIMGYSLVKDGLASLTYIHTLQSSIQA